jgi:dihydrofolate synthase/folylpolyglutamate synthase
MLHNKSPEAFLAPLIPFVEHFWGVPIIGEDNSISAADLAACARGVGLLAAPAPDLKTAVKAASATASYVLICGSLYLAGQVLSANNEMPN